MPGKTNPAMRALPVAEDEHLAVQAVKKAVQGKVSVWVLLLVLFGSGGSIGTLALLVKLPDRVSALEASVSQLALDIHDMKAALERLEERKEKGPP